MGVWCFGAMFVAQNLFFSAHTLGSHLHVKKDGNFYREAEPVTLPRDKSPFLTGSHINYIPTFSGKPRATGGQVVSVTVTVV